MLLNNIKTNKYLEMIIAHRGGQPENSLEAFEFCVLNGFQGLIYIIFNIIKIFNAHR